MSPIQPGGTLDELRSRMTEIIDGGKKGLVVVLDAEGMIDFARDVTVPEIRDALLDYARDLAAYPGDDADVPPSP